MTLTDSINLPHESCQPQTTGSVPPGATGETGQSSPHTDVNQMTASNRPAQQEGGRKGSGFTRPKAHPRSLKRAGDKCHRTQLSAWPREPIQRDTESHLAFLLPEGQLLPHRWGQAPGNLVETDSYLQLGIMGEKTQASVSRRHISSHFLTSMPRCPVH